MHMSERHAVIYTNVIKKPYKTRTRRNMRGTYYKPATHVLRSWTSTIHRNICPLLETRSTTYNTKSEWNRQHSNRTKHRNLQRTTRPGTRRDDKQIYNITSSQHFQSAQQSTTHTANRSEPIQRQQSTAIQIHYTGEWPLEHSKSTKLLDTDIEAASSSNAFLTDKLVKVQGSGKEQESRSLRLHVQGQAILMVKPETTHQRTGSEFSSATPLWETDQSSFLQLSQALFNTTMHHHLYYMLHTS